MGCDQLIDHVEGRLKARLGETIGGWQIYADAVYCLGNARCRCRDARWQALRRVSRSRGLPH